MMRLPACQCVPVSPLLSPPMRHLPRHILPCLQTIDFTGYRDRHMWRQCQRGYEESKVQHMVWLLPDNLDADADTMNAIRNSPLVEREILAVLGLPAEERSPLPHLLVAYW
jgi:hypothetical protein